MSVGTEMSVSEGELDRITEFIQERFEMSDRIVFIYNLEEGANSAYHVLAESKKGKKYGLKICARGIAHGTDKEKIVADLAETLDAPNYCKIEQYEGLKEIDNLQGEKVNVIEWLPNSSNLRSISSEDVDKNSTKFFKQYGEWIFFALAFGVKDRHPGNWVWDPEKGRLSMIDNQDAFNDDIRSIYGRIKLIVRKFSNLNHFKNKKEDFNEYKHFKKGLKKMNDKIRGRTSQVRDILNSWNFVSDYESPFLKKSLSELFPQIMSSI